MMQLKTKRSVVVFVIAVGLVGFVMVNATNWVLLTPDVFWTHAPIANTQILFMTMTFAPYFGMKMYELAQLSNKLEFALHHDHLTQVSTRDHLNKLLAVDDIWPCAVILADLDKFKTINDSYGHLVGDKVLQHFADVMRTSIRRSDIVARYGGEEFVIVLPRTCAEQAAAQAQRICDDLSTESLHFAGHVFHATASFGVAVATSRNNFAAAMQKADTALYAAKDNGRNQVMVAPVNDNRLLAAAG